MNIDLRYRLYFVVIYLLILFNLVDAQFTAICPTAYWNNTFNVIAGISGLSSTTATTFNGPHDLCFTPNNTLYVADYYNNRIQKFVGGSPTATTVPNLTLNYPASINVDNNGALYILDLNNYRVLKWVNSVVTTVAGGRGSGSALDRMSTSYAIHVDTSFNIYLSDCANNRVALWTAGNTNISVAVAGNNGAGAASHQLNCPFGIYVDNSATLYVVDNNNHRVQKWLSGAVVGTTVAGVTGTAGSWAYLLYYPTYITVDQYGYLYIMDSNNERVQRWWPGATYGMTVVATSTMNTPRGIRFDYSGNLVIADHYMYRIISFAMVCPPNATSTVAPTRQPVTPICPTAVWNQSLTVRAGSTGNIGSTVATLYYPHNLYIDIYGNLYVADCNNHRIQKFTPGSMIGKTVAGITSSYGSSYSELYYPTSISVKSNGIMYIIDWTNCRIMKWIEGDPLGSVIAGGHGCGGALTQIDNSYGLFVDNNSNIYISDYRNHRVVVWYPSNTSSGALVAGGNGAGSTSDKLYYPWGIYVDGNQNLYIADHSNHRVQYWSNGAVVGVTVAGTTGNAGPWSYQLNNPTAITIDPYGYIYILDTSNNRVQKWWPGAVYGTTVISASMNGAYGLQFDNSGNIVIADTSNHRIITFGITCPAATTTTTLPPSTPFTQLCPTVTWNSTLNVEAGLSSISGNTATSLSYPYNTYSDGYQNLFVVDTNNHRIQLFSSGSYTATTVAGSSGSAGSGFSELSSPSAIYVDGNQMMYILDTSNYRVLKWKVGDPLGYVVAAGHGGGSILTQISTSYAMFIDSQMNIYISDSGNNRVTKWLSYNTTAGILVAGNNGAGSTMDKLNNPWGIYVDSSQAVFICDRNNHRVQRWGSGAVIGSTVAGTTGSAGPWAYQFNNPTAVMFDPNGFMYILDAGNARIQKWWPGATYGSTLLSASFATPIGMQLDRVNNLVIADTNNHRIVSFGLICPPTTTTTTAPPTLTTSQICATATWSSAFLLLAGSSGNAGSSSALLSSPYNAYFDGYQNLYVVDYSNHRIQQFPSGASTAGTVAGTGSAGGGYSQLYNPSAIYIDGNRNMFILDTSNYRVLRWKLGDPLGYVVAGGNSWGSALNQITTSYGMFVDNQNNVYVSEYGNHRVTLWSVTNTSYGIVVAGNNGAGSTPDKLYYPWGIYVDTNGTLYIVDRSNHRVQRWAAGAMTGITVAGSSTDAGPYAYQFNNPTGIAFDPFGYIYVLDSGNSRVQRWWPGSSYGITVIQALMSSPTGLQVGPIGNLVVTDTNNHRILSFALSCPAPTTTTTAPPTQAAIQVCATAIWNPTYSTLAGSQSNAGSTATLLYSPSDIGFDGYQYMYIVDTDNHRIQRFPPGSNTAATVAGVTSTAGARRSELSSPFGIHVTPNGTMFIMDTNNYRVLRWQLGDPLGYIVAGGNGYGSAFNQLGTCYALFVDNQNNVYVSDSTYHRIVIWRVINTTAGQLVAGGNGAGNSPDKLNSPWGIYVDSSQGLYIVDRSNHRVQYWASGAALGTTVAGSTSDGGPWSYQFSSPTTITLDQYGYIYVLDYNNDRVQKWWPGASFGVTVAQTTLANPRGMRFDRSSNILIADTGYHRILSFGLLCPAATTTTTAPPTQAVVPLCPTAVWNQTFTNIAGALSTAGSTSTLFAYPFDVAFDGYRNMYIADNNNHRIQRFGPGSNAGTTVAGFSLGSGASRSELYYPSALWVTPSGTMFILDNYNFRILKWQVGDQLGYIVAGGRGQGSTFDKMGYSYGIFLDDRYNIYLSEQGNHRVTCWTSGNTTAGRLMAGNGVAGNTADKLNSPWGVYVDINGTIYVVDRGNHRVQEWLSGAAVGITVAGSTSDPGPWSYQLYNPTAITLDQYGYIYVLDYTNARVQKWWPGASYGQTVISASLNQPTGMKIDRLGNMVIADAYNHRVLSFGLLCPSSTTTTTAPPIPTTIALCATAAWNQSVALAAGATSNAGSTATLLYNPYNLAFDGYRNMYVVDYSNHRVQRYPEGSFTATTVAGVSLAAGSSRSEFYNPVAIAVTPNETMYILDRDNYRVLKWQVGDTLGYVAAGGRGSGSSFTQMGTSYGIFLDANYNIYLSEYTNHRITIWTAGNTTAGRLAAGGNGAGNTADKLNGPWGIYVDSSNTMFIVDRSNHRVQRWFSGGSSGDTVAGSTSDPGPWSYQLSSPTSILVDPYGYIYIMDYGNDRVQKWWPAAPYGQTVAAATMGNAYGLALDPLGNMYVADTSNHRILKFSLFCPSTTTTTSAPPTQPIIQLCPTATWNQSSYVVAGASSTSGNTATLLYSPYDVAFDGYQNMFVVDYNNHRIQKFPHGTFTGTTVAGFSLGSGASRAELYYPTAISVTANGTMYIVDDYNFRVLKWQDGDQLGYVVAGGRGLGSTFDKMGYSAGLYIDTQYNLYVSDFSYHRIVLWSNGNTTASRLVAGGNGAGNTADKLNNPWGIHVDSNGTIYIADRANHRVQKWTTGGNTGTTVAGSTSDPGPWSYQLSSPTTIIFDHFGYMYVLDQGNNRVQKWWPGGAYGMTIAQATMSTPYGMRMDRLRNIFIADTGYHRILSFALTCPSSTTTTTAPPTQTRVPLCQTAAWNSTFTTIAGSLANAGSTSTLFSSPYDVTFDGYGYMYVADYSNHRIQRFPPESNAGATVAGYSIGSGASRSELYYPTAIYVDANLEMYIVDSYNYRIMKWPVGEPLGTVIAGGKGLGSTYDKLARCYALFVDSQSNVYVSDYGNSRVTKWLNGNTTVGFLVAGTGVAGNTADKLNGPWGIYVDSNNVIYVVDRVNHRVQKWPSGAAIGTTVAGSTSDPGPWSYQLSSPTSIMLDQYGYIYVLDYGNNRVQKWWPSAPYGQTVISAVMNNAIGMQLDLLGNIVITDTSNHRIISFQVSCPSTTTTTTPPPTQPIISLCSTASWNQTFTLAAGSTSTTGTTATLLYNPYDVSFDGYQNMYIVDTTNHRIQLFPRGSNLGITIAGNSGSSGTSRAELYNPYAMHVTESGTMYILDGSNYRILRWQAGDPIGYVVAGGHGSGSTFDKMGTSYGLFIDTQYNIYISEYSNHRVTKWAAGNTTAGSLVAGGNGLGSTADKLNYPWGVYVDSNNAVFVVDRANHRIQRWASGSNTGTTVAGSTSDPGPWSYQLSSPTAITIDQYGYIYILDYGNARVQKWWPGAVYGTTVIAAAMNYPIGMTFDRLGNIYIADTSYHRVLLFPLTCPPITTPAPAPATIAVTQLCQTATWNSTFTQIAGGTSNAGSTSYLFSSPYDITVDIYGYVYVADYNNHRIQRFPPGSNAGTTIAGFTVASGASRSELYNPAAIYVDANLVMYIVDSYNYRIMKWQVGEPLGTVIAGGKGLGSTYDKLARCYGLFVDVLSNLFVSDYGNNRVTRWANGNTTAGSLVAGTGVAGNTADKLNGPWGIYVDSSNAIFVVDRVNHRVQRWSWGAGAGSTVAGSTSDPGPWSYQLSSPTAITLDPYGYMFILDSSNARVQKWWPGGAYGITVVAAAMSNPIGMEVDSTGVLYVTDTNYHRILSFSVLCPPTTPTSVAPPTLTTTLMCPTAAWNQNATLITGATSGSGSTPTLVSSPSDVTYDTFGNMYVADTGNHRIQQYPPGSNIGTTVAGVTAAAGSSRAELNTPSAIHVDSNRAMYILDTINYRVLKWPLGDTFGTVVVNGRGSGTTLDKIGVSYAMFVDNHLNIYVSEYGNHRVTKWTAGNNTVGQMVAGLSVLGTTADKLNYPRGIYVDSNSVLYVVDRSNHRVQRWPAGAAVGTTVAGESTVAGLWSYQLNLPMAIMFDQYGSMYILDTGNSRIQKWSPGTSYGVTVVSSSMSTPIGIEFDFSGNIIVADTSYHRIVSFNTFCLNPTTVTAPPPTLAPNLACQTGTYNTTWSIVAGTSPTAGNSPAYLNTPMDVYVDGNQNIFVADFSNNRIQKFPPVGTTIGTPMASTVAGFTLAGGSGYSELYNPTSIFIHPNGTMYIADAANYRVQKWLPDQPLGFTVAGGRGNGATYDKVGYVYAIFVDNQGNIYVSESTNNRVTLWSAGNTAVSQLVAGTGTAGTALNALSGPWGVHVDGSQTLYVADRANHRIVKWTTGAVTGVLTAGTTGSSGSSATLLNLPTAVATDTNNYVYVMDAGNSRVQRFAPGSTTGDTVLSMTSSTLRGMRIDSIGNIYMTDTSNHRALLFRCVYNASTTTISTTTTTSETTTTTTSTTSTSTTSTTAESTTSTTTTSAFIPTTTTPLTTSAASTTTIAPTTAVATTTIAGTTVATASAGTTTAGGTTTTVAGGTTTTGAGGTTTTVAGGTTTTVAGGTTATTGAGGTTTTVAGGTTTTGAGGTTTTIAGGTTTTGAGGTAATTGSGGNTAAQAAGSATTAASQSSANTANIIAGVLGGGVGVAAAGFFLSRLAKKFNWFPNSSSSGNAPISGNNAFTRVDNPQWSGQSPTNGTDQPPTRMKVGKSNYEVFNVH